MRKWIIVLFCFALACFVFLMTGCEGDEGLVGTKGLKGRTGPGGIDPDHGTPKDRDFAIAINNNSKQAVDGNKKLRLTFDQNAKATRDTIVASKVSTPPLIDGVDGEEFEWGPQRSRIVMNYLTPDAGYLDPQVYQMICRAAYDDDYLYFLFQWKEVEVKVKDSNQKDSVALAPGISKELDEIYMNFLDNGPGFYTVRPETIFVDDSICPPIVPQCIYVKRLTFGKDTTLVWRPVKAQGEDRMIVMFGNDEVTNWQDVAFREFFNFTGSGGGAPSGFFADVWCWGAATSQPVSIADDWAVDANGTAADGGQPPYIDNWSLPDSVPRFMNRRDPNLKVLGETPEVIYPLWYYDAISYSFKGWNRFSTSFLPGVVTTIPSDSRADVYAFAKFDNGVWILEMKRARRTPYGDDVQF